MTHLFVSELAEVYEKIENNKKQILELQRELDICDRNLLQDEAQREKLEAAEKICETVVKKLQSALSLFSIYEIEPAYLDGFKKIIDDLFELKTKQLVQASNNTEVAATEDNCIPEDIQAELALHGCKVGECLANEKHSKVWILRYNTSDSTKCFFGFTDVLALIPEKYRAEGWTVLWDKNHYKLILDDNDAGEYVKPQESELDVPESIQSTLLLYGIKVDKKLFDENYTKCWSLAYNSAKAALPLGSVGLLDVQDRINEDKTRGWDVVWYRGELKLVWHETNKDLLDKPPFDTSPPSDNIKVKESDSSIFDAGAVFDLSTLEEQFHGIQQRLSLVGIRVINKCLDSNLDENETQCWILDWSRWLAKLVWRNGSGWTVEGYGLHPENRLSGVWQRFDLINYLKTGMISI
jgi:hypothetical protein